MVTELTTPKKLDVFSFLGHLHTLAYTHTQTYNLKNIFKKIMVRMQTWYKFGSFHSGHGCF